VQGIAGGLAGFFAKEQFELGPLAAQAGQHRRQQEGRDRRDHPHPELAVEGLTFDPGQVGQFLAFPKDSNRLVSNLLAQRRETDDPAGALDQRDAEQSLKFAQTGGQGRLGNEAGLGRLAEMTVLAERDEILQLLDRREIASHREIQSVRLI
jgi:hypothetical protein